MTPEFLAQTLKEAKEFFDRSTRCLAEEDSQFSPVPGTWTAAQQVAHAAQTVDWFFEGAFRPEGFSMDFDQHMAEVAEVRSLAAARAWLERSFAQAIARLASSSAEELAQPLPEGPIMGGEPRSAVVAAIMDHTAHHRGVLTVYSRLLGKVPAMPYMDMPAQEPAMAEMTA